MRHDPLPRRSATARFPLACASLPSAATADAKVSTDLKTAIQKGRQAKGWTQKELAQKMIPPIQPKEVQEYESGKVKNPTNQMIAKFEKALGCKLPRVQKPK